MMPMRLRRAVMAGLVASGALVAPALAESQSSNSSSNCSNGRCTRVESLTIEDDQGRVRGWRNVERWREGAGPQPQESRRGRQGVSSDDRRPGAASRGRAGDDDDDD